MLRGKQMDSLEVGWKRTNFLQFGRGSQQKIVSLMIEPAERPDNITNVGADAKLAHPPDIDSDSHSTV